MNPYTELEYIEGISRFEPWRDSHFIALGLLVVVVYFGALALLRLRGNGVFSGLFEILSIKRSTNKSEVRPDFAFLLSALALSFIVLALLADFFLTGKLSLQHILVYLSILIIYQLLLSALVSLCGWVFSENDCAREVNMNFLAFNILIGLTLSPLLFAVFFMPSHTLNRVVAVAAFILLVCLIFRIAHWFKILFEYRVSFFYMILYLCALEILPLYALWYAGHTVFEIGM